MDNQEKETFDTLWKYCTSNNRVCPMPMKWNDLYQMLHNTKQIGAGYEPSIPLILNGWEMSSPLEKMLRLEEHIKWAEKQNQLDEIGGFLRSLNEEDWAHYGEI